MKNKFFILIVSSLFFTGCVKNDVYLKYKTINLTGWNKDSLFTFDIQIKDTTILYNLYINVRNRSEYPYQNMWLFLSVNSPDNILSKDSIECYLADKHGKWLGSGIGSVYEMPVLYQQKVKFGKAGIYRYKIVHGMRDSILQGINDIGMRVEKIDSK
jgi:gliding motility-associated lipoprotein GldH